MPRRNRNNDLLDELHKTLMVVPSWVGPVLAIIVYVLLRYIVPAVMGSPDPKSPPTVWHILTAVGDAVAPFLSGAIIVVWVFAEVQKWMRRRMLDRQSSPDSIRSLSWQEFEQLVGEAYRRRGYVVEETGGGGADGGVDLVLHRADETTLVQCKHWKSWKVGVRTIRELFGVVTAENATRGVVVTCGRFTREAWAFAEGKPLDLVDGPALWELVRDVKAVKQATSARGDSTTNVTVSNAPTTTSPPSCPKCGSPMVRRTAKKGSNAGSEFYGCSQYPQCRGTRPVDSALV